jgi:putative ABC transport system permease protein
MNPLPLVWATLRRNRFTSFLFIAVVALAVGLGIAISAQERALREGSARAADRFDLIVAAPGSLNDLLFSVVYLQPTAVELLAPEVLAKLVAQPEAEFVAPIGFGDNIGESPVVGTVAAFVTHLSNGLAEGRTFESVTEAVVGALAPYRVGDALEVHHGEEDADEAGEDHDEHGDHEAVTVVGRMQPTGTPWDRAIVVPIEYNWIVHELPSGHAATDTHIGPPFNPAHLPGVPAVVVKPVDVPAAYGLRGEYRTADSTAFFPAEVLVSLYAVMGDVAAIMSGLTLAAQVLVVAAILAGIVAILDLQRQRFAVLRALGAPPLFIFSTVWLYVAALLVTGSAIGLLLGWAFAAALSSAIAGQTGVAMSATIGGSELTLVAALIGVGLVLACLPALLTFRRPVVEALRT